MRVRPYPPPFSQHAQETTMLCRQCSSTAHDSSPSPLAFRFRLADLFGIREIGLVVRDSTQAEFEGRSSAQIRCTRGSIGCGSIDEVGRANSPRCTGGTVCDPLELILIPGQRGVISDGCSLLWFHVFNQRCKSSRLAELSGMSRSCLTTLAASTNAGRHSCRRFRAPGL